MRDDFAVFILTHGRPESVGITLTALRKARYSGRWYLVLDDEDTSRPDYEERWGADRILTFSKADAAAHTDVMDNLPPSGVVVYARNALDGIAAEQGVTHYLSLDDDYTYFAHRLEENGSLAYAYGRRLDAVIDAFCDFLDTSGALTVAFAQGGDFIGGINGSYRRPVLRKAMNTFFARTGHPINFVGRINEDVNTYVARGAVGDLFFTITDFAIDQKNTQEQPGGLTEAYLDAGTYAKSFYSVMCAPSCVKVSTIGETSHRAHHSIAWNNAVPKIVAASHRKP